MSSIAAATCVSNNDAYSSYQHWEWLAGYWRGSFCPDITINIQFFEPSLFGSEIIRVHGYGANALLLTSMEEDVESLLSARQERRLIFEVDEWRRVD